MGAATISNLVASLAVQQVFMPTKPNQVRLWNHSTNVALVSRYTALLQPELGIDQCMAYLIGLLHDIGRFVMLEHAEPELLKVDESEWASPAELAKADLDIYKYTHSELGYLASKRWGLPEIVCDVIRSHHNPIESIEDNTDLHALTTCIQAADRFSVMVLENVQFQKLGDAEKEDRLEEIYQGIDNRNEKLLFHKLMPNMDRLKIESDELFAGLGFAKK